MDELESKVSEFREKGVGHVKIGFTDIDGVIRGKYVDLEKFYGLLKKGGGFCDCVLVSCAPHTAPVVIRYTGDS